MADVAAELRYRRQLTRIATGRRVPLRRRPPAPRWPSGARLAYQRLLFKLHKRFEQAVKRELVEALPELVRESDQDRGVRQDDARDRLQQIIEALRAGTLGLVPDAELLAELEEIAGLVGKFNAQEFERLMVAHFGVNPVLSDEGLAYAMRGFVRDNVALIKSVTAEQLPSLERVVSGHLRTGRRVGEIMKALQAQFDLSKSRAALIARDQVGKLNGELTQVRQRKVGVKEYIWSTSKDERVRSRHAALEGTRQRWDRPPVVDYRTGRRGHPGEDYQCRCTPIPVIPEELLEGATEGEE